MLKSLLREILSIIRSRIFIAGAFFVLLFILLIHKLFQLQVVEGADYLEKFTYRIQKETEIKAPRGTIYDSKGNILAYDRLAYSVTIEDSTLLSDNATKNAMIDRLLAIVEKNGRDVINNMPFIINEDGSVDFTGSESRIRNFKKDIYGINYTDSLSERREAMTGQELFDYMRSDQFFNLDTSISTEEAMKIMAVRYELYMKRYQKYVSVTVVSDVSDKMVAAIRENGADLPGVTIEQDYIREYNDSKYFAHITGYTGTISDDQLNQFEKDGHTEYMANDVVGKAGIESVFEYELAGTKGSQTLYVNSLGSVLDASDVKAAVPGNDVYLTIDGELTKTIYNRLEAKIAGILLAKLADMVDEENNDAHLISYAQVFHALIENGIIDIEHFYEEDASELEKSVGERFYVYLDAVMSQMENLLRGDSFTPQGSLSSDYDKYCNFTYTWLKNNGFLNADMYDADEPVYKKWEDGEIGLGDFLKHAISEGWIETSQLPIEGNYVDTSEVYDALVSAILEGLRDDSGFHKLVYKYVLSSGNVTEREVCLLLYDQGVLAKDDSYDNLVSGAQAARGFIYNKIYNMEITPDMLALDICSGACVVTDPKTGEVRALVSYPSYDANRIMNASYYSSLINNESRPLFNRATMQTSAPGSTYKMLSAITGLEEGLITVDDYVVDQIVFDKVAPSASCWNKSGHGAVNVVSAIGQSCNYFFYELGYNAGLTPDNKENDQQGLAVIEKYARLFGFGEKTGIEIGEAEPKISDESCVRSFIGQGTNNYTPTQVNRYTAALANRGTVYELSLVDKVTNHDGATVQEFTPEVVNSLTDIKTSTWNAVNEGMKIVCSPSNTSYKNVFSSLNLTVAGKSGTAQESELKPDHAWFTGYAPADDPQVAVTVLISNGYGSTNVVDTFRDAIAASFNLPLYEPSNTDTDNTANDSEKRHAILPINYVSGGGSMDDGAD